MQNLKGLKSKDAKLIEISSRAGEFVTLFLGIHLLGGEDSQIWVPLW